MIYRYFQYHPNGDTWVRNSEQIYYTERGATVACRAYYKRFPAAQKLQGFIHYDDSNGLPPETFLQGEFDLHIVPPRSAK